MRCILNRSLTLFFTYKCDYLIYFYDMFVGLIAPPLYSFYFLASFWKVSQQEQEQEQQEQQLLNS